MSRLLGPCWSERPTGNGDLVHVSHRIAAQGAQRGMVIARTYCVKCHSIRQAGPARLRLLRHSESLHKKYPVEQLEEALAEGLSDRSPDDARIPL